MIFRKPLQPGQRVFRPFLLAAVVLVCCYAFWTQNQKRLDTIILQGLFVDQTGQVGPEVKKTLFGVLKTFKPAYGIPLEVSVLTRPPDITRHDPARIYLDILPAQRRVLLTLPPLVRRAADPELTRDIEDMFERAFADNTWPQAILPAALAIRATMTELNR